MKQTTYELEKQDILTTILRSQVALLKVVRASAAREGLTIQQFGVLRLLVLRGTLPMYVLSEDLAVSPPVITGIVDRLEGKGLVKRVGSSDDRRTTQIVLTNDGRRVYEKTRENYRRVLREALARTLSSSEQERLAKLMARFASEL